MPKNTPTEKASEATEKKPAHSIVISLDALSDLLNTIAELDTKIASASGSDVAAKKAIIEQLATENSERIESGVSQYVAALEDVPLEVLVGLVSRLEDAIKAKFGEAIDKFVNEKFAAGEGTSKEQVGTLRETRKSMVTKFKALREVLEGFGEDTSSVSEPKRSGGGRPAGATTGSGASTKNGLNKEGYRYLIDGKKRPQSQNTFSSVAYYSTEGCPTTDGTKRWGATKLKDFIQEAGVTFGETESWSVTLPNNKVVSAHKFTSEDYANFGLNPDGSVVTESESEPKAA